MEYPQLTALVPQGEHFDSSAINEGVYLTEGHLNNIEASLAGQATVVAEMQQQIDNAQAAATEAQTALTAATETNGTQAARITELENDLVAARQATPAAAFVEGAPEKDEHGGGVQKEESEATKQNRKNRAMLGLPTNF